MRVPGRAATAKPQVRPPAVAGRFYTARADRLAAEVDEHLARAREAMEANRVVLGGPQSRLVAVVAPHAGHIYSGPTAGFAYAALDPGAVRRVVMLGPAHYVPVDGIGFSTATHWRTPLGDVALDGEVTTELHRAFDVVHRADSAHAPEHSLEVQLPFLQRVLEPGWTLVPLIVGADLPEEVAALIRQVSALPDTLVVVSTDLSHYLSQGEAVARDGRTIRAVLYRRASAIGPQDACGRYPLRGLVTAAEEADWSVRLLDARTSGDTAGDRDRVVGYAAFAVLAPVPSGMEHGSPAVDTGAGRPDDAPATLGPTARAALLGLARTTIEQGLATGRRPPFDAAALPAGEAALTQAGAAFVTLRSAQGALLGCIGSLTPTRSLAADVAEHAYDAAFRDPRFPPLDALRARGMVIDISVLTAAEPFPASSYADLLDRLPVGMGLTVSAPGHRATFLPAVWEELAQPSVFVAALWRKARLTPGAWPRGIALEVYGAEEFAEPAAGVPPGATG